VQAFLIKRLGGYKTSTAPAGVQTSNQIFELRTRHCSKSSVACGVGMWRAGIVFGVSPRVQAPSTQSLYLESLRS